LSLPRASLTFICQSTPRCVVFTSVDQAASSDGSLASVPNRRPETHCRVSELSSFSAMFSQLPCFGVWRKRSRLNQGPSTRRRKCLVERADRVRVQIVAYQGDGGTLAIAACQAPCHFYRPVQLGLGGPRRRFAPASQRLREQEDAGCAGPLVLVVDPLCVPPRGGNRLPKASATCSSVQPGPAASTLSSICARRTF
jgi:hypothetical protein